jgi:hypothetical protein
VSYDKRLRHALLMRGGKFELQALGCPAIVTVVVFTILGARWLGLIW